MKKLTLIIILFMLTFLMGIFIIHYKFSKLQYISVYNKNENKFWAHKGFLKEKETYKINRLDEIAGKGIKGVELDLIYEEKTNQLLVAHDQPIQDYVLLNNYLINDSNNLWYWFDIKNLNDNNYKAVFDNLEKIQFTFKLKNQFIVESKNAKALSKLSGLGLYTCLWINTPSKNNWVKYFYYNLRNKLFLIYYRFNAISMPYYMYSTGYSQNYSHLPVHTWVSITTFHQDSLKIYNDKNLKVVLIDKE